MIDTSPWGGLELIEEVAGGNRNEVWQGTLNGSLVSVRRSRRSTASLQWELDLLTFVASEGFVVPLPIPADSGERHAGGIVVQHWLDGHEPDSEDDWRRVASELQRLHRIGAQYVQRPECCSVLDLVEQRVSVDANLDAMPPASERLVSSVFAEFDDAPITLIHGDPWAPNIRLINGQVGLLDWDESRVDISWHDLSNLGIRVLDAATHSRAERLSNAWEAANGWVAEPGYAQRRLAGLSVSKLPIPGDAQPL